MTTFPLFSPPGGSALIASSNSALREQVLHSLNGRCRPVQQACGGADALAKLEKADWQVLFIDRHLPDLNAEELIAIIQRRFPNIRVVLLEDDGAWSGGADREFADREFDRAEPACPFPSFAARRAEGSRAEGSRAEGSRAEGSKTAGSATAPVFGAPVAAPVSVQSLRNQSFREQSLPGQSFPISGLPGPPLPGPPLPGMIGSSPAMQKVYRMAKLVAGRLTTVLITGSTGTGKELVARALHALSPRAAKPFIVINCAAIPEALLESELFGYTRGAFTGAVQSQLGRIPAAHGGTLFLDEVSELPLGMQAKLLRFLEQKEVQRLGSTDVTRVDVRVVAASNLDLARRTAEGQFRRDLYYRLSAFPIELPPLAARSGDIVPLAEHFLASMAAALEMPAAHLSDDAVRLLEAHRWEGNVRELQHVMERASILAEDRLVIETDHLYFFGVSSVSTGSSLANES